MSNKEEAAEPEDGHAATSVRHVSGEIEYGGPVDELATLRLERLPVELRIEVGRHLALSRTREIHERRLQWAGLLSGFLIAIGMMAVATILIVNDQAVAGTILASTNLAALASVFIASRRDARG